MSAKKTRTIKFAGQEHMPEKYVCDREGWPPGEWDSEPEDRIDFIHAGFSCMLLRGPVGSWCGYVGVGEDHPAFGKNYVDVSVHGGLTYANTCHGQICHAPQPGMPANVYWLGFDTAHAGDESPGMLKYFPNKRGDRYPGYSESYKNKFYVRAETEQLAEQLAVMAKS